MNKFSQSLATALRTLATLSLLLPMSGCVMGSDADDDWAFQTSSSKAKSGKAGGGGAPVAGAAGMAGIAGRSSFGGSPGTAVTGGSAGASSSGGTAGAATVGGAAGAPPDNCDDAEVCGNDQDDDCDGVIDEGCAIECVNHCNDFDAAGEGEYCDEKYNDKHCAADMFQEWCTRGLKTNGYDHWDAFIEQWVDEHCDGNVTGDGEYYQTFSCVDSQDRSWSCQTPLVLAYDGAASVRYARVVPSFTLDPVGRRVVGAWPTAATPWLAVDKNGDGSINDGSELLGSSSVLASGRRARQGFEALAELDTDRDGVVDRSDADWSRLLVWRDYNADGVSTPEEIVSAEQEGVIAVSLAYTVAAQCDALGRCQREQADFLWVDPSGHARTGTVVDLYLPTTSP